jgi:preprotein translocase subunit SecA
MDYLRDGIGLRAMAQRDPLVEYQREGFELFNAMMESIKEETVGLLFNLEVTVEAAEEPEAPIELGAGDARGVIADLLAAELEEGPEEEVEEPAAEPVAAPAAASGGDGAEPGEEARRAAAAAGAVAGGAAAGGGKVVKGLEGLGPRRPDHLQYTAPSETGDVVVQGDGGGGEYAGVGRNALCPCGSGKKFKRCHGDPRLRN